MKRYICYYRVSTKRQGDSGLGLEAQKRQVAEFVRARSGEILQEFVEVESGANDDRPQLAAAISASKLYGAPLLIAKLDRLSRSAAFLMRLQESDLEFTCADMPDVCSLTVGVMALVARQEREAISTRTKAALGEAKARGQVLGGVRENQRVPTLEERAKGHEKISRQAKERAERYRGSICEAIEAGQAMNPAQIAEYFNQKKIPSPKGITGKWQGTQVHRLLDKLELDVRSVLKGETA